jgi:hypothetical protein
MPMPMLMLILAPCQASVRRKEVGALFRQGMHVMHAVQCKVRMGFSHPPGRYFVNSCGLVFGKIKKIISIWRTKLPTRLP